MIISCPYSKHHKNVHPPQLNVIRHNENANLRRNISHSVGSREGWKCVCNCLNSKWGFRNRISIERRSVTSVYHGGKICGCLLPPPLLQFFRKTFCFQWQEVCSAGILNCWFSAMLVEENKWVSFRWEFNSCSAEILQKNIVLSTNKASLSSGWKPATQSFDLMPISYVIY